MENTFLFYSLKFLLKKTSLIVTRNHIKNKIRKRLKEDHTFNKNIFKNTRRFYLNYFVFEILIY